MKPRTIEILCFASCPNTQATIDRVREESAAGGIAVDLRVVWVESEEDAQRFRFVGSPSVRVDGRDVDPEAEGREDFGLQCRMYADESGLHGVPPAAWIRTALLRTAERFPDEISREE
jgi:hypothetical protein